MTTVAAALDLPFQEAVDFFRAKARVPTDHWTDVWREAHSQSFMVAGAASDALLADFQAAIQKALDRGTTLAEFRADFDAIVERHGWAYNGSPGWRSRIIYETNLSTAYSAGRYAQLTEPDTLAAFPFWEYRHSGSQHPRLQHLAWDGLTLRADDPFWGEHYPPNGWRCGCRVNPVSRGGLSRMGKSGPDTAPPRQTYTYVNKKTGLRSEVPVGIDPGFDYNPGAAWQRGTAAPAAPPGDGGAVLPPAPVRAPASPAGVEATVVPRTFDSVQEADAALTELGRADAAGWTAEQAEAVTNYKAGSGRLMNEVLRGARGTTGALQAEINELQGLLSASRAQESLRVHRGVGQAERKVYAAMKPGDVTKAPAFVSTTLSREIAGRLGEHVVQILVPKGLRGAAYIHPFPGYRYPQYEMLLAAGVKLRRVVDPDDEQAILLEATPDDDDEG